MARNSRNTEKIRRFGHDKLSTYGIGNDLPAAQWRSVVRQLVAANFLYVDVDGHGGLRLTPGARPVLKGEHPVQLRQDPKPSRRATRERTAQDKRSLTPENQSLFEALRTVRLELAREQGVPPYVIFHDRTLLALAERRPRTPAALSRITGIGNVKLERYGEALLDIIRTHTQE